jgi:hypothetical protein
MRRLCTIALVLGIAATGAPLHAEEPNDVAAREYGRGNELARATRWAEALGAFEASLAAKPHALTLYNIGVCERVLGRATRARERFRAALERATANPGELPPSLREEVEGFLSEYDRILPRVAVTLDPADAGIAVDGRPLRARRDGDGFVLEAGVEAPGIGKPPPVGKFELEVDPGSHVLTITRQGYRDVVVTRDFVPGQRGALDLALARLPAILHIGSTVPGAQVRVDGVDVGLAPVDVIRPAGTHHVVVSQRGWVSFTNDVTLGPGEETSLKATLAAERTPITKQWWFWTGAVAVVATATLVTWLVVRPAPEPQPYDGGSTGWVVFP